MSVEDIEENVDAIKPPNAFLDCVLSMFSILNEFFLVAGAKSDLASIQDERKKNHGPLINLRRIPEVLSCRFRVIVSCQANK